MNEQEEKEFKKLYPWLDPKDFECNQKKFEALFDGKKKYYQSKEDQERMNEKRLP